MGCTTAEQEMPMWTHTSGFFSQLAQTAVVENMTVIVSLQADSGLLE